uniref:Uncharacterized protein n=3 Tax=Guillardia theta TaxID=55529 RepID=A0A6U6DUI0_GUITH|mmetsp:Transcript_7908/g.26427  ORF Transcript_7908/g.26427 Transcript_7908/m.26427 type:complete len:455 (+) Transcript_7908:275-1639(+)
MAKGFWHRAMKTWTLLSALVLIVGCIALSTRGIDMRTKEDKLSLLQSSRIDQMLMDLSAVTKESSDDVKSMKEKIKQLRKQAEDERSKAANWDKTVRKQETGLKKKLEKAKDDELLSSQDEDLAQEDVERASKMRKRAQRLKDESDAARRKFVAQEHPIEMATKLAGHDHKEYRRAELAVASEVAKLSEHPNDSALRKKVDHLVSISKKAKARMEDDGKLLKKLESKTADAELGGQRGYAHLRAKSVEIAKQAESVAENAVSLAKRGEKLKAAANKITEKVVKDLKVPDALHLRAQKERKAYKAHMLLIRRLQAKIDKYSNDMDKKKSHTAEESSDEKYDEERTELEKIANGSSDSKKRKSQGHSSEVEQLVAAKDSYDQLEELELKKEKAKLRMEREHSSSQSSHSSFSSETESALAKKDHLLSISAISSPIPPSLLFTLTQHLHLDFLPPSI